MQAPHQVAQKLMRVSLPEALARRDLRSSAEARETSTVLESSLRRAAMRSACFLSPFRGTAEDARVCCRRIFVGEKRLDNVAGVLGFDEFTAIAVVHAAFVAEVAGLVEDENVRRGLRPVGAGD